jgi:acetate kinase
MGMTPLEGLIMGTRPGDLDPGALLHLLNRHQPDPDRLAHILHHECGLRGICGMSDMRAIQAAADSGDADAELALEMFCYRIRKYIGAYLAVLGGADAIVFTGGIGENDGRVRERVCAGLERLGIHLDPHRNSERLSGVMAIQSPRANIAILVIATDEAREIAAAVDRLLNPHLEEPNAQSPERTP